MTLAAEVVAEIMTSPFTKILVTLSAVDLAAGSEMVVHRDIQPMYTSSKVIRVATFAMKREGSEMPLPPADLAGAQAVQLGTAGVPIPESMAGSIFSGL